MTRFVALLCEVNGRELNGTRKPLHEAGTAAEAVKIAQEFWDRASWGNDRHGYRCRVVDTSTDEIYDLPG